MFVRRYPLTCRTGVVADAMTGIRMIWNEEEARFSLDPSKRKVNKKLLHEAFAETYGVQICDGKKALRYILARGDRINKHGLNMEQVYAVSVFTDGKYIEEGDRSLWDQHRNDLCDGLISIEFFEPVFPERFSEICLEMFQMSPMRMRCGSVQELLEKAFSGVLEKMLKALIFRDGFGFELEFTGITRRQAAAVVADFFGTTEYYSSLLRRYLIKDQMNREWQITYDGSIQASCGREETELSDYRCELVSPICSYDSDMKTTIQPLIRALRANGAVVNNSCGFHVHVSDMRFTPVELQRLVLLFSGVEDLLFNALSVWKNRQDRYCHKTDEDVLQRMISAEVTTMEELAYCWYGNTEPISDHYHDSRYVALNFHSLFDGKGIEYRLFNATLHAGKIRSYVVLALALSNIIKNTRCLDVLWKLEGDDRSKMTRFLDFLGITECPEYHAVRRHLLRALQKPETHFVAA